MLVIGDIPCSGAAGAHMRKRGRDPPVMLGTQTVQLTALQRVGEWPEVANAASLSPSASATVCHGGYGVEDRLST